MNLLTLVRIGCRITVISWWIVRRSITVNDALITHHQFPAARVPRWKLRADHDLRVGRRSAAQQCRNHSQSQNQPLHLSLPTGHPRNTLYRVPEIVTRGRFPDGGESDSTWRTQEARHVGS